MLQQLGTSSGLSRRGPTTRASFLSLAPLLLLLTPAAAHPYPKDDLHDAGLGFLMPRDCAQYCGYDNQYCCATGQECYTSNNIAGCKNTAAGGGYNLYTTTWTLTETFTSTYSSLFPAATTAAPATCVPEENSGQVACGSICCADWQYCAFEGQCSANVGWGGATATATATATAAPTPTETYYTTYTTGGVVVTTSYEPAFRVTGSGTGTATGTAVGATGSAESSTTSSHKLSGGAIAGIVIGVLAGVALLIAICACVLVRGLWHGVMALLGLGKRKDHGENVTVIEEEEYRRHSGTGHGSWYGSRPPVSEKRKSGGRWLGLGAAAGTLLLLLGLRRKERETVERRQSSRPPRSEISSDYYTYSDPSSRGSRQSRGTRASRRSDPSRVSRASRPSRQSRPSRSASRR